MVPHHREQRPEQYMVISYWDRTNNHHRYGCKVPAAQPPQSKTRMKHGHYLPQKHKTTHSSKDDAHPHQTNTDHKFVFGRCPPTSNKHKPRIRLKDDAHSHQTQTTYLQPQKHTSYSKYPTNPSVQNQGHWWEALKKKSAPPAQDCCLYAALETSSRLALCKCR